jgi:hypothetical protein
MVVVVMVVTGHWHMAVDNECERCTSVSQTNKQTNKMKLYLSPH